MLESKLRATRPLESKARAGLRAFVISGNLGQPDSVARYDLPPAQIEKHIAAFIAEVGAAA